MRLDKGAHVTRLSIRLVAVLVCTLAAAPFAAAQDDDPAVLNLAEPDFTLVGLETSLRVPFMKSAFRVTHRFTRPLKCDDCGDNLLEDFFGIDNGALVGLEYRFGIVPNGQVGIHRTGQKTIEFFGQYSLVRQTQMPLDISALVTIEGTNNFKDSYSPAVGAVISRRAGDVAAFYLEPIWVNNTNELPSQLADHNDTFIIGVGARIRILSTVTIAGEVAPRVSGYKPGVNHGSVAIEKRVGGHLFQLNFSNSIGTTMGQIARGGGDSEDWYMGFNISRKFF
jgi:Membrane bound beta barrel domain (DUF5777)